MRNEIKVDIEHLQNVRCPTCKKKVFESTYEIRYLPAIISPNNRPGLIKVPVNVCHYCGAVSTDEILIKYNQNNGDKKQSLPDEK
jgi:DNA-directed RNA polymerase subunit RPC12/RpoP